MPGDRSSAIRHIVSAAFEQRAKIFKFYIQRWVSCHLFWVLIPAEHILTASL